MAIHLSPNPTNPILPHRCPARLRSAPLRGSVNSPWGDGMRGCNRYRRMVFKSFLCAKGASRSLELRWRQAATSRTRFLWSSLRLSLALE
ncbi:unnamed protein product [Penicillium olsonii]|nr:unnamed protein product [Penicillium olsonii]